MFIQFCEFVVVKTFNNNDHIELREHHSLLLFVKSLMTEGRVLNPLSPKHYLFQVLVLINYFLHPFAYLHCLILSFGDMENESELRNMVDVEIKMGEITLPFNDIVPHDLGNWFDVLAKCHGTTRELLLISALTSTSALVDKSTVKVFSTYEEKANLFFIAVAPSGCGKTPACHLGCIDPIVEHLEPKLEKSIVVDEASANGLFNHFSSGDTVPILCVDEAQAFMSKILSASKAPHANLTIERLCKCFDGDCWYVLKGNKGKRTGVKSARISLLAFTTPREFLGKTWPKILAAENGLAERVLLFYQKMVEKDLEAMAASCVELEEFPINSLRQIFEQVYAEHTSDGPVQYTLAAAARDAFFKFSKPQDTVPQSQASIANAEEPSHCKHSKRNKHVLRLALSMHVLYDRLQKALTLQAGPITSRVINVATLNMAIAMVESLEIFMGISETVSHD